ncbi:TetR/AcrR family transcriptional regulator [Pseudonocardia eucalypti]|uniref:TetR/AcrR family transcriptional regulator n=1 Tax=Pseudonocardia eucalypti TaxID=648755 RepID=A0ABP9PS16_9PSEU
MLCVAGDLFYREGIRATGVDKIAADAGVAPTTLYRLFPSKDELVAAYTERAAELRRRAITDVVAADGRPAGERILALFEVLSAEVAPAAPECRGCTFLMVLTELPDDSLAAHRHAVAMKRWIRDTVRTLTAELPDEPNPDALADQLVLILDGYTASAQALGPGGPAAQARPLVERLLALGA